MEVPKFSKEYDAIIVGAGPAGCSCALALKGKGLSVALVDKSVFPRDKICGDAIPGRAIKTLRQISPAYLTAFEDFPHKNATKKTNIYFNGQEMAFNWSGQSYTCARKQFDNFLFSLVRENTDTAIYSDFQASDILVDTEGVTLSGKNQTLALTSKIIIGADGAHSVVAKNLTDRKLHRDHHVASVRAYYAGVIFSEVTTTEVYLHKKYLPSYLWVFPISGNLVNVGFGMLSSEIIKRKVNIKDYFYQFINDIPELKGKFLNAQQVSDLQGFGLPLGSMREKISGYRFMLTGDAASLIDPVSGDGIGNAMLSGKLAAEQVQRSFERADFSEQFMKQYDTFLYKEIGSELSNHYRLQRALAKMPYLIDILFWASRNKFLGKVIQKQM